MAEALLLLGLAGDSHRYDHPWRCHRLVPVHFTTPSDKSIYGREYLGNERTTFIVNADGKVAEVLRKVKPADHDELALSALAEAGL